MPAQVLISISETSESEPEDRLKLFKAFLCMLITNVSRIKMVFTGTQEDYVSLLLIALKSRNYVTSPSLTFTWLLAEKNQSSSGFEPPKKIMPLAQNYKKS